MTYPILKGLIVGLASAGCLLAAAPADADSIPARTARIGWLDKITARVGEFQVPVGEAATIGNIQINVKSCIRRVPPDDPESAAFMVISEAPAGGGAPEQVFQGWMFASSPALSAMDHSVFDVWVLECGVPSDSVAGSVKPPPNDGSVKTEPLLDLEEELLD